MKIVSDRISKYILSGSGTLRVLLVTGALGSLGMSLFLLQAILEFSVAGPFWGTLYLGTVLVAIAILVAFIWQIRRPLKRAVDTTFEKAKRGE